MYRANTKLAEQLQGQGYIVDTEAAFTLELMLKLQRPLLVEGEAGVGKTELGKALASARNCPLIRLQCYDGLDTNAAVYEWNYSKQLLSIKLQESSEQTRFDVFSEDFLLQRPLLQAIRQSGPAVLLIDEIDRADEAFEAYLLELLSDFQITVPELGTIKARFIPQVILTSNATRELSDALRRRCLYHYLDYPDYQRETQIIRAKLPDIETKLTNQIVFFVQQLRNLELQKRPGIAETLDWSAALFSLHIDNLVEHCESVFASRSCLLKTREDMSLVNRDRVEELLQNIA